MIFPHRDSGQVPGAAVFSGHVSAGAGVGLGGFQELPSLRRPLRVFAANVWLGTDPALLPRQGAHLNPGGRSPQHIPPHTPAFLPPNVSTVVKTRIHVSAEISGIQCTHSHCGTAITTIHLRSCSPSQTELCPVGHSLPRPLPQPRAARSTRSGRAGLCGIPASNILRNRHSASTVAAAFSFPPAEHEGLCLLPKQRLSCVFDPHCPPGSWQGNLSRPGPPLLPRRLESHGGQGAGGGGGGSHGHVQGHGQKLSSMLCCRCLEILFFFFNYFL